MSNPQNPNGFIPQHGGYENLLTYKKAEIIYDATVYFCNRFFHKYDRTIDQMVQAARSGKQNIVEGSMASATSKETELKLTNVARSSIEELKIDYQDFLRTKKLPLWDKNHRLALRTRELCRVPDLSYETFRKGIEHPEPEICANVIISIIKTNSYLLSQQMKSIEQEFLKEGGIRERMTRARINFRNNK